MKIFAAITLLCLVLGTMAHPYINRGPQGRSVSRNGGGSVGVSRPHNRFDDDRDDDHRGGLGRLSGLGGLGGLGGLSTLFGGGGLGGRSSGHKGGLFSLFGGGSRSGGFGLGNLGAFFGYVL